MQIYIYIPAASNTYLFLGNLEFPEIMPENQVSSKKPGISNLAI